MHRYRKSRLLFPWLIIILLAAYPLPVKSSEYQDSRKVIQKYGFELEYFPEQSELANDILELLKLHIRNMETASPDILIKNKERALSLICRQLALEKPTADMVKIFDGIFETTQNLQLPSLYKWQLWDRSVLKQLLASEIQIPCFSYNKTTDRVFFSFDTSTTANSGNNSGNKNTPCNLVKLPIIIDYSKKETPAEQAELQIKDMFEHINSIIVSTLGNTIHETTEFTIVKEVGLSGPYRRWFAEGVSNYVAFSVLRDCCGQRTAETFLNSYDSKNYQDIKEQVNLESWLAAELEPAEKSAFEERRKSARYAYATYEIKELAARNGEDIIPKIFAKLGEMKNSTIDDVIMIIKTLTGEDFQERLSVYEFNSKRPELNKEEKLAK